MRRTGRVIVVFFLVFFCMAGLWLFQSFRESRVVKTKKEYRNVYITDVKQQKVEGIWRGQKKTWQLRSAVSKEKISGVADLIEEQGKVVKVRKLWIKNCRLKIMVLFRWMQNCVFII